MLLVIIFAIYFNIKLTASVQIRTITKLQKQNDHIQEYVVEKLQKLI